MSQRPALPKGTRDFNAEQVVKRQFLRDTIVEVYERFGFEPLETPSMELLSTLTGKYGAEGDQLLFRILKSGDFLKGVKPELLAKKDARSMLPEIAEKGLRYDLTVPFARYVVMNQHNLTMPFRRYQVQPVWRADRPQKGRYQEFWQCDADVIGSETMLSEVEFIQIYEEVFRRLGIKARLRINNRKILNGVASLIKAHEFFGSICVAMDKMDKIGADGVREELLRFGLDAAQVDQIQDLLAIEGSNMMRLNELADRFAGGWIDPKGIEEMWEILSYASQLGIEHLDIRFDLSLARGLSYYTGTIFEVVAAEHQIGSLSGGGRYDDLTGVFGLPDVSGVGISFGMERLYDVLEEQGWPVDFSRRGTRVVFFPFEASCVPRAMECLRSVREAGINAELHPDLEAKLGKKIKYADKKGIPFAAIIGPDELESGLVKLKVLSSGDQESLELGALIERLRQD
jgi:histidyl-tRNA synthetase